MVSNFICSLDWTILEGPFGDLKLWEEETRNSEYIYDCEPYQLAVKLGIIGILLQIVLTITNRAAWFFYVLGSEHNSELFLYQTGLMNLFSFVGMIFISVGFVGIFLMKKSNLGIIFPILAVGYHFAYNFYLLLVYQFGIFSFDYYILISPVILLALALLKGLALLTIRNVSANRNLLYFYVAFSIGSSFLTNILAEVIRSALTPIDEVLASVMYLLTYSIMSILASVLLLVLFLQERKQGCTDMEYQEVPVSE